MSMLMYFSFIWIKYGKEEDTERERVKEQELFNKWWVMWLIRLGEKSKAVLKLWKSGRKKKQKQQLCCRCVLVIVVGCRCHMTKLPIHRLSKVPKKNASTQILCLSFIEPKSMEWKIPARCTISTKAFESASKRKKNQN